MSDKRNYWWVESENVAGCECCAWYTYHVEGFDKDGNFQSHGPFSYREEADDFLAELEKKNTDH